MAKAREGDERSYARSLREYARGVVGGLLFSLPLLYTMEVWWAGFIARPFNLLLYLSVGFLLLFGYNRYAGLHKDASWLEVGFEAVEEMGLGILVAAGILWLLGQIDGTMPVNEIMGKTVVEAVTVAIGVSVGSAQLATGGEGKDEGGMEGDDSPTQGVISQVVLGACGAVLFASNVAPTEEIVLIAIESSPWKILGLALLSLAMAAVILFYSDFTGSDRLRRGDGDGPGTMVLRTAVNYAVALAASAFILWFFGRFDGMSFSVCMAQTVALGVAASLGASAGRLLLQA
ncbi:MAG TPA: TIGR02587 family membrane protein [Thermoanaerobaculia bacterium]